MIEHQLKNPYISPGPEYYLSPRGPFQKNHNLLQFYGGAGRGRLLDRMVLHVQNSDDQFWVRGEAGSGKSMLSLVLANRLKSKFNIVRCEKKKLSAQILLQFLIKEIWPTSALGMVAGLARQEYEQPIKSSSPVLADLQFAVEQQSIDMKPFLLVVDHGAQLSADTRLLIDQLRRVTRGGFPVFKIVLFETLDRDDPRLGCSTEQGGASNAAYLRRFTLANVQEYLEHHMMLFDFSQRHMFTREMAYFIADRSDGLVREINVLVRNAFTLAGIQNEYRVSMSHLLMAGLPRKPEPKKSTLMKYVRLAGYKFAIAVSSVIVLVLTWLLTN